MHMLCGLPEINLNVSIYTYEKSNEQYMYLTMCSTVQNGNIAVSY